MNPSKGAHVTDRPATRAAVVARLRDRLQRDSFPRLTVLMIVLLAGGGAFLFSAITLTAGLDSMALRYGLAALTGYISFALLIRGWIAMRQGDFDLASSLPIPDRDLAGAGASAARVPRVFTGGRSGGGGSTGGWTDASSEARSAMPIPVRTAAKPSGGRGGGGFLEAYLLQMAAPEARSIGGVVRALTSQ